MPARNKQFIICNDFPAEVISMIVQYLHDDVQSLIACSQVSKIWVAPTRKHLFRQISLRPKSYRQFFALQENAHSTITPSNTICALTMRQHRNHQWSPTRVSRSNNSKSWPWVAEHLPTMTGYTKVRDLTLEYITDSSLLHSSSPHHTSPHSTIPLHASLSTNFSSVTRLTLFEPNFAPFSLLIATITSLPNLQSLTLDGGSWPEDEDIPPPSRYTLPSSLTTLYLSLEDQMLYDVLCWLNQFTAPQLPKIHTLTLGQPTSIDVCDASSEFITLLGPSLVNLTLLWFADLGRVELSTNTSLRTLFIDGIDLINIPPLLLSPLDWGAQAISTIISTNFESIIFGLCINNLASLDQLEWCAMKRSLQVLGTRLHIGKTSAGGAVVQEQGVCARGLKYAEGVGKNGGYLGDCVIRRCLPKIRFLAGPLDDEVRREARRRLEVL